jgi:PmbA protein
MTQHSATATPLDLLDDLIARARRAGADAADALHVSGADLAVGERLGQPEKLESSESADLGLRVLIGNRQACVSSTDLDPATLDDLVERAIAMAKAVPEDRFAGLAPAELLAREIPDLDLDDGERPDAGTLRARVRAAEAAAMAVEGVTNSEGAEASWGVTEITLATSGGFSGTYRRGGYGLFASVIAGSGTGMETDYDWTQGTHVSDLRAPEEVGRSAGERAVARLGARKIGSARVPILYDRRVAGSLLGHLLGAINGAAIARGTSFLKDRLGETVFTAGVSVTEDPLLPRGVRSRPFDAEGVATRRKSLIENGRLTTWLLDSRTARQLGLETTGNATRGTGGPPSPGASNVFLEPGTAGRDEMIAGLDKGLLITSLMGSSVNPNTGDYSRGASGFWIENGEIAYPVSEITVAGNLLEMYANLTPADDLERRTGVDAPTLRGDGMTVAGR